MFQRLVEEIQLNNQNLLQRANAAFLDGASADALKYCELLLLDDPSDVKALRLKANVLNTEGELAQAIGVISQVLTISAGEEEPCDYFYRGRWLLANGELLSAIEDFSALLTIEGQHVRHYYSDDALLHRAFAYHRLRRDSEAVTDLRAISDEDCVTNISGDMISKRILLGRINIRA